MTKLAGILSLLLIATIAAAQSIITLPASFGLLNCTTPDSTKYLMDDDGIGATIYPINRSGPYAVQSMTMAPFWTECFDVRIVASTPLLRRASVQQVQVYDFSLGTWVTVGKMAISGKAQTYTIPVYGRGFIAMTGEVRTRFIWDAGETRAVWIDCICYEFRYTR